MVTNPSNLLQLEKVGLSHEGRSILENITFSVSEGERVQLVGPSGSGKSTILKLIAGIQSPTKGHIFYQGKDLDDLDMPLYRRSVSYCYQQPVLFGKTVEDNLAFLYQIRQEAFNPEKALDALASVDLSADFLQKKIIELSGGEKQRVALIRNVMFEPDVLLLDEITAGLDARTKEIVHELLENYHLKGKTLIEVSHDQDEINQAKRIISIQGGRMQS